MSYKPTIGLEIHTELKTRSKMFCGCANDPDEKNPNYNVCPVCTGHPGTLPTINLKAVKNVLKLGMALDCKISEVSKFDRKNYFYPDLPKGYQISQYDQPLCSGGKLEIPKGKSIRLRRIHLEEDTGRLLHSGDSHSLVDYNRSSIPLMELVTEPDIETGEEAVSFARELQRIMRYMGISDADMEKGHMRVEANISISKDDKWGTKVEVKNLNSFRAVSDAIDYEIKRQEEALESGGKISQETRGWNESKKITVSQRSKEEAHDYRYFPEPDLPPMDMKSFDLNTLRLEIPELPAEKRKRFITEFNLSPEQADIAVEDRAFADFFEKSASELKAIIKDANYQLLYNYCTSDLRGLMGEANISIAELKINPEHFAHLISLAAKGQLTSRMVKDVLREMFEKGSDPERIIKDRGLGEEIAEDEINSAIEEVIKENEKIASDYKSGKDSALQFLIGQAMKKLKSRGSPQIISKALKSKIGR